MRYVDDFVIMERNRDTLDFYKREISRFLVETLKIELHPDKSKIMLLSSGIQFVGFRIFYHHKILRKNAIRRIVIRINEWEEAYINGLIDRDKAVEKIQGWMAYAINGNTFNIRKKVMSLFNRLIPVVCGS
jgi:hypothetical protein